MKIQLPPEWNTTIQRYITLEVPKPPGFGLTQEQIRAQGPEWSKERFHLVDHFIIVEFNLHGFQYYGADDLGKSVSIFYQICGGIDLFFGLVFGTSSIEFFPEMVLVPADDPPTTRLLC